MHLLCTIRRSADEGRYDFLVRDLSRSSVTLSTDRPVLASDRARIGASLAAFRDLLQARGWACGGVEERLEALQRVGDEIADYLLPQPVYRLLADPVLKGSTLTLETNELQIPWEVTRIEGEWLWERFIVGRQQILEARREGAPSAWSERGPAPRKSHRMLVVADPEEALPTAREEADALRALCEATPGWEAEVLVGRDATSGALIERLQRTPFDVLHLACTAVYDPRDPGKSRLFLADEPLPAGRLSDVRFAAPPRLVFLNACQAAREDADAGLLARTSGWGRLFVAAGADTVIGPLWDVRDRAAVRLAEAFYRSLLDGAPLGEALQRARRTTAAKDDAYLSAHAYVTYGNPALRFGASPAEEATTEAWVLQPRFHLRVESGPQAGRVIPLLPKTMLEGRVIPIGSAGERVNDIDLGDATLDNAEAHLVYSAGLYHLVSEAGRASLDDRVLPTGERAALAGGETIRLGECTIAFVAGAPQGAGAKWALEVVSGADQGQRFPLLPRLTDLGRGPDCAVRLTDPAVSRRHATLTPKDDGWAIAPRSSNPTLVNGMALADGRPLRDGDEIQLSEQTVLRFFSQPG